MIIGGNGFIGSHLVRELLSAGHQVAVFHRSGADAVDSAVFQIRGDRNRLPDYERRLREFSPEVIIDLILSSGRPAQQLMKVGRELACRVVAISSMDVYRPWGLVHGSEPGPLEPMPITEESPLRTVREFYPAATLKRMQSIFSWLDDEYDKIAVEEAILNDRAMPGSVVRLPMVYGPGDPLHRFFPLLKRIADKRPAILLADDLAAWRGPRGYVENVAHAIAVVATSEQGTRRVYNVCDEPTVSEVAWLKQISSQTNCPASSCCCPERRHPRIFCNPATPPNMLLSAPSAFELSWASRNRSASKRLFGAPSVGNSRTRRILSRKSSSTMLPRMQLWLVRLPSSFGWRFFHRFLYF
ncbi:UDP-glucose 4-epimerase [Acidisarcina polymorpha]|uniref:UDP-glucose 4-epimerase n=1 Tax=Acidisarcina polymorpha TaxID=2211140 RepID=A0A2Z5G274_9BACT|nr:UDP-glucose 4-epimerase [Acidisarcina polymorpha]